VLCIFAILPWWWFRFTMDSRVVVVVSCYHEYRCTAFRTLVEHTHTASGGGGGRGTAPFLRVAPLSYPQPGLQRVRNDEDDHNVNNGGGGGGGGGASTTATSWAVSAHAWLSASLTNAFASPSRRRDNGGGGDDDEGNEVSRRPKRLPPPPLPDGGCCGGGCSGC
jgi:hypothetical protein